MPSSVRVRVCSHGFRVSHGKIAQTEPMGHHNELAEGWQQGKGLEALSPV